jgi:pyruvate dehydrogenase E1 component beta subunit
MGEDIGRLGGVFGNTQGLLDAFGPTRVRDTPISEMAFVGAATGAATCGLRPVVDLMFVDFIGVCLNALYNLAAKNNYFSGGQQPVPMVLTSSVGGGYGDAGQHSQCLFATFAHFPGLKVVAPSNAYDAKGLMIASIRDPNPVVFLFHKALQGMGWLGTEPRAITPVPQEAYEVPIGLAEIVRPGSDITVVGLSRTVHLAQDAAECLEPDGISCEVIDLRSLVPLDRATVIASVRRTGRLLVVDDDYLSYGVSSEIIALVAEAGVPLRASPRRIAHPDVPIPYARPLELFCLPNGDKVVEAVREMVGSARVA